MNVLQIVSSMDPMFGGVCQGIRNCSSEWSKLEVYNEIVCLDSPTSDYLSEDNFQIHALGASMTPWKYHPDLKPWIEANLTRFDIVIIHGLWLYHSYITVKIIEKYKNAGVQKPKVFIMPHGMLDPYFQHTKTRRFKALRNSLYWKFIENKVVNNSNGVLFTCEEELLLARKTFPNYRPKKEINVSFGIERPPIYNPIMSQDLIQTVPKWNKKPFLLFLSRINSKKGIDLLIKTYIQLEKENKNLPQLLVAGPFNHSYGIQMQNLAAASSNILFTGMLSGYAKWGAFYESEVFILPSHQENFGIAVVEALACSKPVLISDRVNIWREIAEGEGGIVKKDTQEETYSSLKLWMKLSLSEKTEMAKNALKIYKNNFTVEQAAIKFLNSIRNA